MEKVVPRLHALTLHPAEDVRSASIQQLAKWDRAKQYIEQDIIRMASSDVSKDVQISAVGASSIATLYSDELKRVFFKLLETLNKDEELFSVILYQIDRFALNAAEYATYKQIEMQMGGTGIVVR